MKERRNAIEEGKKKWRKEDTNWNLDFKNEKEKLPLGSGGNVSNKGLETYGKLRIVSRTK